MRGRCRRSVFKREETGARGGKMMTLAAHPHAPFFASVNAPQVVKLWALNGDRLTGIRPKGTAPGAPARVAKTTCMAFAPFEIKLATGAVDATCSVYTTLGGPATSEDGAV